MAYIGQGIKGGTFSVLDTSGNTYNGSNVTFDLGTQVGSPAQLLVSHDGVIQKPVTDYTIATGGTQITFTTAPASGASIFITEISGAVGAPMNRDINGDELILDADADTSITADTDDQIDIRIAGNDDFKLTAKTLTIGGGAAADTAIVFDGNAQDYYIGLDDSGDEFQIGKGSTLAAGREFSIGASGPVFNEDSDTHDFRIETDDQTHAFFIHGANDEVSLNESASDTDPGGLCINHGSNDAASITLKNSDVAHGVTDQVETDTYAFIGKNAAANGGLLFMSFSEGDNCHTHEAFATSSNTTQNGSGGGPFKMNGRKKSGTGATAFGSGDNVFLVQNNGQTDFIVDGNGDIFYDGSASAYDSYDDAQLVRAFDIAKSTPGTIIQSKWDDFVQYKYDDLREAGILGNQTKEDDEKGIIPFTCVTKLQKLHNGAIWQQYEKHNQLLEAVYDLATIAVGEEKANAILDKHEVKRLQ